jgi:hypothetical protein
MRTAMNPRTLWPSLPLLVSALWVMQPAPAAAETIGGGGDEPLHPLVTGNAIASLALANVGGMACAKNSLGGSAFGSSCTGNGGSPEYWCADFALWVWANAGVSDVGGLDAAAGSFYVYGQNHGTLKSTPSVGDAVVFDYQGGGVADHVALVTQVNSDGTIETVSGDWNGDSGTEAQFASTSHVVLNSPAYPGTDGSTPSIMGMTISGFISPVGLTQGYAAAYVSQSFPLASSALQMATCQTIPSYIEMKNVGGKVWDTNTHLGTTQPRDRDSVFADSTWLSANRPSGVKSGTVAVGSTYKVTFDLHAPDKPGTYFEYFNLVEEGVAWFSDSGQGGPPDDDLEVQIVVTAGSDTSCGSTGGSDAGSTSGKDGGVHDGGTHDGGSHTDAGAPAGGDDAGGGAPTGNDDGGTAPAQDDAGVSGDDAGGGNGDTAQSGNGGGCAMGGNPQSAGFASLLTAIGLVAAGRRRKSAPSDG